MDENIIEVGDLVEVDSSEGVHPYMIVVKIDSDSVKGECRRSINEVLFDTSRGKFDGVWVDKTKVKILKKGFYKNRFIKYDL